MLKNKGYKETEGIGRNNKNRQYINDNINDTLKEIEENNKINLVPTDINYLNNKNRQNFNNNLT